MDTLTKDKQVYYSTNGQYFREREPSIKILKL